MKRTYYIDGEEVTRHAFFKQLENSVYHHWRSGANIWWCFEDYYGYIKSEIRGGSVFNHGSTFYSEVL
jgi:hypothetical protein